VTPQPAVADLMGRGGPFETGFGVVMGERMKVFMRREEHLRALLRYSSRHGDAEYLVFDGGVRWSYLEHLRRVVAVSRALEQRYGIHKGERVAILAANCPEWIVSFWAATSLGAVAVGLNAWWSPAELQAALENCKPKVLIADEKQLARLGFDPGCPIISVEHDFEALYAHDGSAGLPRTPIGEDDPACILYTSGTTGAPKGVVHTHRNVIAMVMLQMWHGARASMGLPAPLRHVKRCHLVSNPLFHVSGLYTQVVTLLVAGVKTVWTRGRFDAGRVLELIEEERVTGWSPHGAMAPRLLAHPDLGKRDLSTVLTLGSGGAPVTPALQAELRRAFPNARGTLTVGYGSTECTALATIAFGDDLEQHPTSVGRPLPTVELDVRDGEIHIRSPLVMKEYFNNPEATRATLLPGRWLRTGDIGRIEDGRLYIDSRARDLILRGAENVFPPEIERRLEEHPDVSEAAVLGVEHPELGQEVKAVVVPKPGRTPDPESLKAWCAQALAYYKVPSQVALRDEPLPRNAAGKVMKQGL